MSIIQLLFLISPHSSCLPLFFSFSQPHIPISFFLYLHDPIISLQQTSLSHDPSPFLLIPLVSLSRNFTSHCLSNSILFIFLSFFISHGFSIPLTSLMASLFSLFLSLFLWLLCLGSASSGGLLSRWYRVVNGVVCGFVGRCGAVSLFWVFCMASL